MNTIEAYKRAMDMVKEVDQGPVSKFSEETRCFAELIRSVDHYYRETQKRAAMIQAELTDAKGKLAGMKLITRDCGTDGWVIDYKTLERIAAKASKLEPVSMEGVEAVVLALVDDRFVRLEKCQ